MVVSEDPYERIEVFAHLENLTDTAKRCCTLRDIVDQVKASTVFRVSRKSNIDHSCLSVYLLRKLDLFISVVGIGLVDTDSICPWYRKLALSLHPPQRILECFVRLKELVH